MGILIAGLVIGLVWYFIATRSRLDKDRDQHHLASLLISAASGGEASREDAAAFIAEKGYAGSERASRLNHAVKLAATAVSGDLHARVVALARDLKG